MRTVIPITIDNFGPNCLHDAYKKNNHPFRQLQLQSLMHRNERLLNAIDVRHVLHCKVFLQNEKLGIMWKLKL